MSEEQLIQLVKMIRGASGCVTDLDGLLAKFEASVKDPSAAELIFLSPTGRLLSPEEVVEKAGVKGKP